MGVSSGIRVISECFVKPKDCGDVESNKPFHLGVSGLAQLSQCYIQTGGIFVDPPRGLAENMSPLLERLKDSLSTTLSLFYPLAGQLVTEVDEDQHTSFIFVDRNKGPGTKFIHAALDDVTTSDIISTNIAPEIVQSLFELGTIPINHDAHSHPILTVQVTQLADGFFLGISVNHSVVDGISYWHFVSSWSEIFRSNDALKISRPPIFERWFQEGYGPIIRIPHIHPNEFITRNNENNKNPISDGIFPFSFASLSALKAKANAECMSTTVDHDEVSSFQALCALLWRCITRARCFHHDHCTTCTMVADARQRLNPPLTWNYFGSFNIPAITTIKAGDLLENSLGWAALLLHRKVQGMTDEYVRKVLAKWVESPTFNKARLENADAIVIGGGSRADENGADFGLGKPVAMLTGTNKYEGKVTIYPPGRKFNGSIEVCLPPKAMTLLQQDEELMSFLSYTPPLI